MEPMKYVTARRPLGLGPCHTKPKSQGNRLGSGIIRTAREPLIAKPVIAIWCADTKAVPLMQSGSGKKGGKRAGQKKQLLIKGPVGYSGGCEVV